MNPSRVYPNLHSNVWLVWFLRIMRPYCFFFLKQQKLPDLCVEWTLSDLLHRLVTRSLHSIYSLTKEALLYHLSIPMKHHVRKKKIVYIYRLSVITRDFRKKREEEHHSIALYVIGCYC